MLFYIPESTTLYHYMYLLCSIWQFGERHSGCAGLALKRSNVRRIDKEAGHQLITKNGSSAFKVRQSWECDGLNGMIKLELRTLGPPLSVRCI
jgi:hypothetical protein